ncbi:tetratricopeptide repeat protein [Streptomyces sp. CA-253872]|uniref:tetratricopeptide repeat protein n=1 Tax=Streptomyces sp. CA-253872 TaxID=3240067 RepID=UPI003D92FDAA
MLEVVTAGALSAFLGAVYNGAAGEVGKQLLVSTHELVHRTLGRRAVAPTLTEPAARDDLAARLSVLLRERPALAGEWRSAMGVVPRLRTATTGAPWPPMPIPPRSFQNREKVLDRLDEELKRPYQGAPRAVQLYGPAGIGTSATALHWMARREDTFGEHRIHLDLRDVPGVPAPTPAAVLAALLARTGLAPDALPPTEQGRIEEFRRRIAGQPALVVIDHVTAAAQVRHLVPTTSDAFLLVVVSGPPLPRTALEATRVDVPPLSDRHALALLRSLAAEEAPKRRRKTPAEADVIAASEGNAQALLTAVRRLIAEHEAAPHREESAHSGDPVREAARHAHASLPPASARVLRLSAVCGWPLLDAGLAASLAAVPYEEAVTALADAVEHGLLDPRPDGRHRFSPRVRDHLADAAGRLDGLSDCALAVRRGAEALRDRALRTARAALPQSWRTAPPAGLAGPAPGEPASPDPHTALAHLCAETPNIVAAVTLARDFGHPDVALALGRALWPVQLKSGYWDETLPAMRLLVTLADEYRPGTEEAAAAHFQLAHCLGQLGRYEEARTAAGAARAHEEAAGHLRGQASAVEYVGLLHLYEAQPEPAQECLAAADALYGRIGPDDRGFDDLPRAQALLTRHQGRALWLRGRLTEARAHQETAVGRFEELEDDANRAKTLSELAETLHTMGRAEDALTHIEAAEELLGGEEHARRAFLVTLRERVTGAGT